MPVNTNYLSFHLHFNITVLIILLYISYLFITKITGVREIFLLP